MTLGDLEGFRLEQSDALFLDFDGTLAEIIPDPAAVTIPPDSWEALTTLATFLEEAVALLSGRDIRDLMARTPDTVWRAGGHGLDIVPPGEAPPPPREGPPEPVLSVLKAATEIPGVRLELKGPVAALHYRQAPDAGPACLEAARQAAAADRNYVVQAGKMVVEVKPVTAHKGLTLRRFLDRPPFAGRRPVMLGDDATDEDAIEAALALGGVGVKVGPGESHARLRAPGPPAVRAWLHREARRAGNRGRPTSGGRAS